MKAIVHIGPPKTGSTSIQTLLWENREVLKDRGISYENYEGVQCPQSHYAYAVFHRLGELPAGPARFHLTKGTEAEREAYFGGAIRHLEAWRDRHETPIAVFSSEHFGPSLGRNDKVQPFHDLFDRIFDDVEYVFYVRNPVTVVPSTYSEQLKSGSLAMPIDLFLEQRSKLWSQLNFINRWRDVVGDRLNVRLFEADWWVGGSLLSDFCSVLGTTTDGLKLPERVNEKLSAPVMRAMTSLNRAFGDSENFFVRIDRSRETARRLSELLPDAPQFGLNKAQIARIEELYREETEEIRRRFFPDREVLYTPPPFKPPPPVVEVERLARDALALLYKTELADKTEDPFGNGQDQENRGSD